MEGRRLIVKAPWEAMRGAVDGSVRGSDDGDGTRAIRGAGTQLFM